MKFILTGRMDKTFVKVCPTCGSKNIALNMFPTSMIGGTLNNYCKKCKYGFPFGAIFPEIEYHKSGKPKKSSKYKLRLNKEKDR